MIRSRPKKTAAAIFFAAILSVSVIAQETQRQYLSGHDKDDAIPWNFFCTGGAQSGYWTNLVVPSNWELHGFGTLTYHRDVTNQSVERGLYEHDFTAPADWSGRRVFLIFEGVMTDTSAKLNGQPVGAAHQGGYYRFKYEVTKLLKFGVTNRLEVAVDKHSQNASVNKAERTGDYWMYGGIFRPVYLEAVPQQFIERVAVNAQADGNFSMDVFLDGITNTGSIEAQIETLEGKTVGTIFDRKISGKKISLQTKIISPELWTAETPNLYRVEVRLKQNGGVVHQIAQRFGFRTFEVRDGDGLYLNGRRVILKGCGRHSFWPDSGRCLSEAVDRLDIETMKDMNMNAVRMTHYPPDAEFLDLCDELGLYVLDELTGWHRAYDTVTGTKLVGEMVTRDVNHPSILFWDNGNEGGFNTNLDTIFGEFDPQQRRVLHPWASFDGLCTAHYLAYDKAEIACTGKSVYFKSPDKELVATNDHTTYIYMPTEFLHGLYDGGAGAGLEDYWRMMSASKLLGGGFIWAFLDEGVKNPFTKKIDVAGNQAPDGIVGPYREREASFYTIKKIWSPIQITRETNGTFTVENHYSFTDANQCGFEWQLRKFPTPSATNAGFEILDEGRISTPSIAPGQNGSFQFDPPDSQKNADALVLRVSDPDGRELWTYVWPLRQPEILTGGGGIAAHAENFGGKHGGTVKLKSKDVTARIDAGTGRLLEVRRDGKKFSFSNGPRLAATNSVFKNISWQLRDDGWLQCDYTYAADGTNNFFGVIFDYPENLVKSKRWLGDGPYRVWKNRLAGTTPGVWQNDYNNTITGFRGWIYPEFKGCFSNVRWLQLDTTEGQITVVPENVPFVQVLTPEFPPTNLVLNAFAPLPKCGLGFLDAIPAIGSSTKKVADLGPQSQPNVARGEYHGTVSFYFGKLP
jgi:hypothetical protein